MRFLILAWALILALPSAVSAEMHVVNPEGTGDFPTIQAAMDAVVDGDIIELTNGIFTGEGNRDIDYLGKGVRVRSRSGDPDSCIIDCQSAGRGFYLNTQEGPESVLQGVTIRSGSATDGGGIYCGPDCAPTIINCVLSENFAVESGGGIYCLSAAPTLSECRFFANTSQNNDGGGICCESSSASLADCVFSANATGVRNGAGLYCRESSVELLDCVFSGNTAARWGGGMYSEFTVSASLAGCTFDANRGSAWAGLALRGGICTVQQCVFSNNVADGDAGGMLCTGGSVQISECTFSGNVARYADGNGGGLRCSGSALTVTNCTFVGNSATGTGGGIYDRYGTATIENTIIAFSVQGEAIGCHDPGDTPSLSCCDLFGNEGGDWVDCVADQGGGDNISADPRFCDWWQGNFTLQSDSPCAPENYPECGLIGAWPVACATHMVTPDGSGDFPTIQAAIDAIPEGDVVLLTDGTFTGEGNRDIDFGGKAVVVRSQSLDPAVCVVDCEQLGRAFVFDSGESSLSAVEGVTICNGLAESGGAVFCNGSSPSLLRCVIVGGVATAGGAVYCMASEPWIANCTLAENTADYGAGVFSDDASSVRLENTIIAFSAQGEAVACDGAGSATLGCCDLYGNAGGDWVGCVADQFGTNGNIAEDPLFCGPGDFTLQTRSPCIPFSPPNQECTLVGALGIGCHGFYTVTPEGTGDFPTIQDAINYSADGDIIELTDGIFLGPGNRDLDLAGRAITLRSASNDPRSCVIDCQGTVGNPHRGFYFHSQEGPDSRVEGIGITGGCVVGNLLEDTGGAVLCRWSTSPRFANCIFHHNTSDTKGGAVRCDRCAPSFIDCTFYENSAYNGGALYCWESSPVLERCTIAFNTANVASGLASYYGSNPVLDNCILAFGRIGASVRCLGDYPAPLLACCDIYGHPGGDWVECIADQFGVDGNICEDPLFCDPENGDFTLAEDSPCAPFSPPNPECDLVGAWPVGCGPTAVSETGRLPLRLHLGHGVPNPFATRTAIAYGLPFSLGGQHVVLRVYDLSGRLVRCIVSAPQPAGTHSTGWDGADEWCRPVAGGIYFCRLTVGDQNLTRRLVLVR